MSAVVVHARARGRAALLLLAAGVCWGTGGLAGSVLVLRGGLHPLSVATYRLLLGGALVVLFLLATSGIRLRFTSLLARRLLAAGALLAVFQASYFAAVTLISVSIATMVAIGSVPVFVAVAGSIAARRLPSAATVLTLGGAVLGLVLLTWSPVGISDRGALLSGVGFALLAGGGFAVLTLLTQRQVAGLDSLHTAAFGCLVGGALLLPIAYELGMSLPWRLDVLAAAGYLGAVPTAFAYAAYFRGLVNSAPIVAALAVLAEPLTATLLAVLWFGDRLGWVGWCGAALIVATLAVSQLRPSGDTGSGRPRIAKGRGSPEKW